MFKKVNFTANHLAYIQAHGWDSVLSHLRNDKGRGECRVSVGATSVACSIIRRINSPLR